MQDPFVSSNRRDKDFLKSIFTELNNANFVKPVYKPLPDLDPKTGKAWEAWQQKVTILKNLLILLIHNYI